MQQKSELNQDYVITIMVAVKADLLQQLNVCKNIKYSH